MASAYASGAPLAEVRVFQRHLAEAFGDGQPLSLSLISSWESARSPVRPPLRRLRQYARSSSTPRSVAGARARVFGASELTPAEQADGDTTLPQLGS